MNRVESCGVTWSGLLLLLLCGAASVQGISVRTRREVGVEGEGWSAWGDSSPCSRTCGGGVQFQERTCSNVREDGSPDCRGPSKIYMSCNVQECDDNRDFRAVQCAQYNSVSFNDKYYEWLPYYGGHHKCQLNCLAKGESFYYRHAAKVVDGTPCTRHSNDVCVDGVCQPVGCDKMLGSSKQLDDCHICGGDGSTCQTVQGEVTTDNLKYGYSDVLLIPAGATAISIDELAHSNNYLAIRSMDGEYYLNGDFIIDLAKHKTFAGSKVHYNRGSKGDGNQQHIRANGPTTEALFLLVLKTSGPSPNIKYKYSLSREAGSGTTYAWRMLDWQECSHTCAGGIRTREVECIDKISDERVPDNLCDPYKEPERAEKCNQQPCEAHYEVGAWQQCSTTCGKGLQARRVYCRQLTDLADAEMTEAEDAYAVVNDTVCAGSEKPQEFRPCNQDVECPVWEVGTWSACNRVCGPGQQSRGVLCRAKHTLGPDASSDILPAVFCQGQDQPGATQECNEGPCEGREWIVSRWSQCHGSCEDGYEARQVVCSSADGQIFPDNKCDEDRKPERKRPCDQDSVKCRNEGSEQFDPEPHWHFSQWSECSAACGPGVQTRSVLCAVRDKVGRILSIVGDAECNKDYKMAAEQDCSGDKCAGAWFAGPFGKCSAGCGGGEWTRTIVCMSNNKPVSPAMCDSEEMPDDMEPCNTEDCTEDQDENCENTRFGCCPDMVTKAESEDFINCPSADRIPVGLCISSPFGCCLDGITAAQGPFNYLCPQFTCKHTEYGCCEDGNTPALDENDSGCPPLYGCESTAYGCCSDRITAALQPGPKGCEHVQPKCRGSEFGCCEDGVTEASGPNGRGCEEEEEESSGEVSLCLESLFGCCDDGKTFAEGPSQEGCNEIELDCEATLNGCCPDGITRAQGRDYYGCPGVVLPENSGCANTAFGCCRDLVTAALGPDFEGCGDDQGTQIDVESCEYTLYGCCEDGISIAAGENGEGCYPIVGGCAGTRHGCCLDGRSSASGPEYEGCENVIATISCEDTQFGCCPDSLDAAQGPHMEGCDNVDQHIPDCDQTTYGCCPDGTTVAAGDNFEGCREEGSYVYTCVDSPYGCCADGVSFSRGPRDAGCPSKIAAGARCGLEKEGGSCGNFSVKWYFDVTYGACSRFWYGGCEGNDNRFDSREECDAACSKPVDDETAHCYLPASHGHCSNAATRYHYNPETMQCDQFQYGGCVGNANNFESSQKCQESCVEPQRPTVCSQPQMPGPCRGQFVRWFYDDASGMCRQFLYGGCKGNNNRFETKDKCMQTCEQSAEILCKLEKKSGPCEDSMDQWYFNKATSACERFVYGGCQGNANRFPTEVACKAKCRDLLADKEVDMCRLPKEAGPCKQNYDRWYYDDARGRCEPFKYGGCHGNKNRFNSEQECRQECDMSPPVDVCTLILDQGDCAEEEFRYYFSQADGQCHQFIYSGCAGNGNNFLSLVECEKSCHEHIRPVIAGRERCTLPAVSGSCMANLPRFYFNTTLGTCEEFVYGGCHGNKNRFISYAACMQSCGDVTELLSAPATTTTTTPAPVVDVVDPSDPRVPDVDGQVLPDDLCGAPYDSGDCLEYLPRWYYDDISGECGQFVFSGCGGNANRFETQTECMERCGRPKITVTGLAICALAASAGTCRETELRWHYDKENGRCVQFYYGGCEGNENNFVTEEECLNSCPVQELCTQTFETGPCRNSETRYYYEETLGQCLEFIYGGCEGNANNFLQMESCQRVCQRTRQTSPEAVPPTQPVHVTGGGHGGGHHGGHGGGYGEDVCSLPQEAGTCFEWEIFWFYDYENAVCNRFYYGGCDGNANRFRTQEECQRRCEQAGDEDIYGSYEGTELFPESTDYPDKSYDPYDPDEAYPVNPYEPDPSENEVIKESTDNVCTLDKDYGPCMEYSAVWYFEPVTGTCRRFLYGGCGGNGNRFTTRDQCEERCLGRTTLRELPTTGTTTVTTTQTPVDPDRDAKDEDKEEENLTGDKLISAEDKEDTIISEEHKEANIIEEDKEDKIIEDKADKIIEEDKEYRIKSEEDQENKALPEEDKENKALPEEDQENKILPEENKKDKENKILTEKTKGGKIIYPDIIYMPLIEILVTTSNTMASDMAPEEIPIETVTPYVENSITFEQKNGRGFIVENSQEEESSEKVERFVTVSPENHNGSPNDNNGSPDKNRGLPNENLGSPVEFTTSLLQVPTLVAEQDNDGMNENLNEEKLETENVDVKHGKDSENDIDDKDSDSKESEKDANNVNGSEKDTDNDNESEKDAEGGDNGEKDNENNKEVGDSETTDQSTQAPLPTTTTEMRSTIFVKDFCLTVPDRGPCLAFSRKWYYDPDEGDCRTFVYGGCAGNDNNFPSKKVCKQVCLGIKPVTNVCMLQKDKGPCQAPQERWYYDPSYQRCLSFQYGGCSGNQNNFESEVDCLRMCGSTEVITQPPRGMPERACQQSMQIGSCFEQHLRYYYDDQTDECRPFVFSGCDGNENNFQTQEECYASCSAYPESHAIRKPGDCYDGPDAGPCQDAEARWYYDINTGMCVAFYYGGCAGNLNNFRNYEDCNSFCSRVSETCGVIQCNMECDFGYERGVDGCPMCACADPCNNYECGEEWECVVEETPCAIEPCPGPQPTCKPKPREGECPAIDEENEDNCFTECQSDYECPQPQKCCENSCGRVCIDPALPDEAPEIEPYTPKIIAAVGERIVLPCRARGAPRPVVDWYRNRLPLGDLEDEARMIQHSDGSLEVLNVTPSDTSFSCRAYNNIGSASQTYNVVIHVPLTFTNTSTYIEAVEGEDVLLPCQPQGSPAASVTWQRGNDILPLPNIPGADTDLLLPDTLPADSGMYRCVASNGLGEPVMRDITLKVFGKFSVEILPHNTSIAMASNISLECVIDGDSENVDITWYYQKGSGLVGTAEDEEEVAEDDLEESVLISEDGVLMLDEINMDDSGSYRCEGVRGLEMMQDTTELEVYRSGMPQNCTDQPWYANCNLIIEARLCRHPYFRIFCCKSCYENGRLP